MVPNPRSKIHPKVIFKIVSKDHNVLVVGTNNYDIKEVLKHKKANITEINSNNAKVIIEQLGEYDKNQFDFIILNLEASKLKKLETLVHLISEKSKIAIFRVRNKNFRTRRLVTRKDELLKYFKQNDMSVLQRFYCRKNKIYHNILAHFFSYYMIYITIKNGDRFAFQEAFTEKFLSKVNQLLKKREMTFASTRTN